MTVNSNGQISKNRISKFTPTVNSKFSPTVNSKFTPTVKSKSKFSPPVKSNGFLNLEDSSPVKSNGFLNLEESSKFLKSLPFSEDKSSKSLKDSEPAVIIQKMSSASHHENSKNRFSDLTEAHLKKAYSEINLNPFEGDVYQMCDTALKNLDTIDAPYDFDNGEQLVEEAEALTGLTEDIMGEKIQSKGEEQAEASLSLYEEAEAKLTKTTYQLGVEKERVEKLKREKKKIQTKRDDLSKENRALKEEIERLKSQASSVQEPTKKKMEEDYLEIYSEFQHYKEMLDAVRAKYKYARTWLSQTYGYGEVEFNKNRGLGSKE